MVNCRGEPPARHVGEMGQRNLTVSELGICTWVDPFVFCDLALGVLGELLSWGDAKSRGPQMLRAWFPSLGRYVLLTIFILRMLFIYFEVRGRECTVRKQGEGQGDSVLNAEPTRGWIS